MNRKKKQQRKISDSIGKQYVNGGQTCFSPRCVSAEHSIYFTALILLANFWPCSRFNGDKPCSDKALNVSRSSLKSILVPILMTKEQKPLGEEDKTRLFEEI